jgi:hypothetical protein
MKIESSAAWPGRIPNQKPQQQGSNATVAFGDLLKKTLEQAAPQGGAPGTAGQPPAAAAQAALGADSARAVHRLDAFLDLLDGYREKLADPRVSLKRLDAVVKRMDQGRADLESLARSLPEEDGLRDIVNHSLVTASLEIIKFRRGDYLPA